ncbi:methyltransferase domain-containing protein [Ectothiorhodospiraceae bacterium WFHF3C12]|nr:methyltransferase domain-containing protein [Ectothiorhodospiraceae bacterium WFHF3C12]
MDESAIAFVGRWLRHPRRTGAIIPSSRDLARVIAQGLNRNDYTTIVELGAGTGTVTRALVERFGAERVVALELSPGLARQARKRNPGARVVVGCASELDGLLEEHDTTRLALVSCLPLLSMPNMRRSLLQTAATHLGPEGCFVQFTYSPWSPFPAEEYRALGLRAQRTGRAWRNVPPASVWRLTLDRMRDAQTPLRPTA